MMEIISKILFIGGFLVAILSQICIIALAFKNRYYEGLSCLAAPMYALVSSELRKDKKIRIFLKLWGGSLPIVILGAYILAVA